jgi:NAD(P)-dependent dehydrogenase (short-subunit alcohol dehydrogenase family)
MNTKSGDLNNQIYIPENIGEIFNLTNYNSIITGGASGLGEAIALGFANFGSDIVLCDMNVDGLARVKKRVETFNVKCQTYKVDVTKWDDVVKIQKKLDRFDVLVNCAGVNIRKAALDLNTEEYKKIINVNQVGTFNCCKAFGSVMVENKSGSIINMSSINGHIGMKKQVGYASSKGAVIQLTKVLALEWAKFNVRVNALSPAHHKTPLIKEIMEDRGWYNDIVSKIPLGRFADPFEIVGPAVFLASKASSFITGSSLLTDGGFTAI